MKKRPDMLLLVGPLAVCLMHMLLCYWPLDARCDFNLVNKSGAVQCCYP